DGEPFEELQKTENTVLKIGAGAILAELDEGLIGMAKGESKEIPVKFPGDYVNQNLADVDITFHVTLHEIREETLPEIDDEMAKKLGPFESMDQVKEAIGADLKQRYAQRTDQELNEQAFSALLEKVSFETPDCLVQQELEKIVSDFERSFAQQEKSLEDMGLTRDGVHEQYKEVAEKKVRRQLLLGKIIEQENITASEEDVDNEIQNMAQTQGQPADELKKYVRDTPGMTDYLKMPILEKKATRLILDSSDIEEVTPEAKPEEKPEENEEPAEVEAG
ncbi:MAG: trigger factor, partial [Desulfobacterales bacterium]|nr:trigger factor [Desulfobacterales bacterium]